MPVPIVRPGRVALDNREIARRRKHHRISFSFLASTVATLGRARGITNLDHLDLIERTRAAGRERQPLIVSERVADLYALVLDVPREDIEYVGPIQQASEQRHLRAAYRR